MSIEFSKFFMVTEFNVRSAIVRFSEPCCRIPFGLAGGNSVKEPLQ